MTWPQLRFVLFFQIKIRNLFNFSIFIVISVKVSNLLIKLTFLRWSLHLFLYARLALMLNALIKLIKTLILLYFKIIALFGLWRLFFEIVFHKLAYFKSIKLRKISMSNWNNITYCGFREFLLKLLAFFVFMNKFCSCLFAIARKVANIFEKLMEWDVLYLIFRLPKIVKSLDDIFYDVFSKAKKIQSTY